MKRICIFSFYDKDGIVDSYIDYLLYELKTVADSVVVVANGYINEAGKNIFQKYADEIYIRTNEGYDVGAYVDVLQRGLGSELQDWDELIFCNDTFYGPFIPMKDIFSAMDTKDVDYWGLNIVDRGLLSYIQSYFLVFRKRMLQDGVLLDYLYANVNLKERNISNVYGVFEAGLYEHMKIHQYTCGFYTDTKLYDVYENSHVCIEKYNLPILKKKSFGKDKINIYVQKYVIYYLYNFYKYDVNHILKNARRQYEFSYSLSEILEGDNKLKVKEVRLAKAKYTKEELVKALSGQSFYIYGAGTIARELYKLYFESVDGFLGFVISNGQEMVSRKLFEKNVWYFSEIESVGVIVLGVSNKLAAKIQKSIMKDNDVINIWEE